MNTSERQRPEPSVLSIQDTALMLGGISPNHVRNLISTYELEAVRVGRRVMVSVESIKRFVAAGGVAELKP